MKISIVLGTTGEYSDRDEWIVAAFFSAAFAEEYAEKANQWCIDNGCSMNSSSRSDRRSYDHRVDGANPYDSNFRSSYTGTEYFVADEIPIMDAIPGIDSD